MPKIIKSTGGTVTVWGLFSNPVTKAYIDPETVTLRVRAPNAVVTNFVYGVDSEIVRDTVGNYYYNLVLSQRGTYHWKWSASTDFPNAVVVPGELDSVSYPIY